MNRLGKADKVFYYTVGVISGMMLELGILIALAAIQQLLK